MILTFGIAGIGIAAWLLGRQIGPRTPVSGSHMALLAVLIVAVLGAAVYATASAQPGDSTSITALKAEAQKAIDAGELAKADALLADVETEQSRAIDNLAVNAAETSARPRARAARLGLDPEQSGPCAMEPRAA